MTLRLIEERVRKLKAENATSREAAKLRDYQVIEQGLLEAASNLGMRLEIPFSGALGRQALAKSRALKEAELRFEEGDDIARGAQELIADHLASDLTTVNQVPVTLKMAVDNSLIHAISAYAQQVCGNRPHSLGVLRRRHIAGDWSCGRREPDEVHSPSA
ncbi:hypothetical protein [Paracoccus sp. SY]|uniref:hypothetical protein n=1 Tax=Paracoccus sp. SY TaxID=1330255 RepID=UPI000CD254C7|nr:hypothetical protein [Paracoccus sp. SY]